jgi:hypothetical protein
MSLSKVLTGRLGRSEQTVCVRRAIRTEVRATQIRTWEVKMETARISAAKKESTMSVQSGHNNPLKIVRRLRAVMRWREFLWDGEGLVTVKVVEIAASH